MTTVEIIADSVNVTQERLTTFKVTFPRIILPEILTHKIFSISTSLNRTIPFKKMVKVVKENPFIPIAWQKTYKGMQGSEYIYNKIEIDKLTDKWLKARDEVITQTTHLHNLGVTKQLCNRLLEPFMWVTMIITSSRKGLENFFELSCPRYGNSIHGESESSLLCYSKKSYSENFILNVKPQNFVEWESHNYSQAEIHVQDLAEKMYDAYNEHEPIYLSPNKWHIPFEKYFYSIHKELPIKYSTALCAKVSHMEFDNENISLDDKSKERLVSLHDKLLRSGHMNPFEHCARALPDSRKLRNLTGFMSYRYIVENS